MTAMIQPEPFVSRKNMAGQALFVQGGTSHDVVTLQGEGFHLVGSHVFRVRPGLDEEVDVTRGQDRKGRIRWTEVTAHSDLMLNALADGTTRCIRHGIPRRTDMYVTETGASWKEPAPFPDHPTLYYAGISDGSVRSLGDVAQDDRYGHRYNCVEAGNRLYWTKLVLVRNEVGHCVLMSANKDGSDIREVLTQRDQHPIAYVELQAYRGGLYCFLTETPTLIKGLPISAQYLCRLRPDRSEPLDILYRMPENTGGITLDGGYAYLGGREPRRSLWATLTNDNVVMETTDTLYRIPLNR